MIFSLSGRLIEGTGNEGDVGTFLDLAKRAGYDAVDLRASQVPDTLPEDAVAEWKEQAAGRALSVACLNVRGKADDEGLAGVERMCGIAAALGCDLIRVGGDDVAWCRRAARAAAEHGVRLASQMHTNGGYETPAVAAETLAQIGETNFGVIIEPSNLMMAGVALTRENLAGLAGHVFMSSVQSCMLDPDSQTRVRLRSGEDRAYRRVAPGENPHIDFPGYVAVLRELGFDGAVNLLEPHPGDGADLVGFCADYLRVLRGD